MGANKPDLGAPDVYFVSLYADETVLFVYDC